MPFAHLLAVVCSTEGCNSMVLDGRILDFGRDRQTDRDRVLAIALKSGWTRARPRPTAPLGHYCPRCSAAMEARA